MIDGDDIMAFFKLLGRISFEAVFEYLYEEKKTKKVMLYILIFILLVTIIGYLNSKTPI